MTTWTIQELVGDAWVSGESFESDWSAAAFLEGKAIAGREAAEKISATFRIVNDEDDIAYTIDPAFTGGLVRS